MGHIAIILVSRNGGVWISRLPTYPWTYTSIRTRRGQTELFYDQLKRHKPSLAIPISPV